MAYEFKRIHRVEFSETDMAGIVHFVNFFRYMETTEHAFLRSLGFSVHPKGGDTGWPRVQATCQYHRPLHFEDEVEIHLRVRVKKARSIVYDFKFKKVEGEIVADGSLTVVYVRWDTETGKMKSCPIPDEIAQQIEVAPPSLDELD